MRDKILFVCPTNRWEARERSLIQDIEIALEKGKTVTFYGLKDSPLDKKVTFDSVEKYYHPGLVQTHFFLWPKLSQLATLLDDPKLAAVHCFKLNILWPICFFLRGNKVVSVIFSQFFELKKNYRAIWHRLLVRRCDLIFVPYEHLVKNVWSRLGVHPRRIEVRPPFLKESTDSSEEGVIFEKFEQFHSIGVYVSDSDKEIKRFVPFLNSLKVANENFKWDKPVKLVFVTEGVWSEKPVHNELKQFVLDLGIEEHIIFYSGGAPSSYIQFFDIWMSSLKGEGVDDFALLATSIGTPILLPRHPSASDFFGRYGRVGESFKNNDVREIAKKWEMILSNPDGYRDEIERSSYKIRQNHSISNQKNQYVKAFSKVVGRREAYNERKSSKGPSTGA